MSVEIKFISQEFFSALRSLEEGVAQASTDLEKDGVVQRFEFTFELSWKLLKVILESEGQICRSPKSCLQMAFKSGFIEDEGIFLQMLNDRNRLSHIYNEIFSKEIFDRIKQSYMISLATFGTRIAEVMKKSNV